MFGAVILGRTEKAACPSCQLTCCRAAQLCVWGETGGGGASAWSSRLCAPRADKKQNSVGRSATQSPTHSTPTW